MKTRRILLAGMIALAFLTQFHSAAAQAKSSGASTVKASTTVPFVGCESDGQVGPLKAPSGQSKMVAVPVGIARQLAYYQAEEGFGVLAPQGWHCFSMYGSNGDTLFVSPDRIDAKMLFSSDWHGFPGQVIQISESVGDTSGRFEVAKIIARVFPAYKEFVHDVIAEGIEPAASFPSGPYPNDRLTYLSKRVVEFETPPNTEGLGTDSRLLKSAAPIQGVAILFGEEPSLLQLSIRLSESNRDFGRIIVESVEREDAKSEGKHGTAN